ncbi:MAG TPA: isoprenylcysteine carboxylmethyltransferase family protein [Gemmatimonadales bacterium]
MRPLLFTWPYLLIFWAAYVWSFFPEMKIVRGATKPATRPDSPDAGSLKVILFGMGLAIFAAFPMAWIPALQFPASWQVFGFGVGVVTLILGSLLRRHCFRMLGASFTGDVRARPGQTIVQSGAYAWVRHPSYSAGTLMNLGLGLALGSWGSTALIVVTTLAVYSYRIAVEERALLAAVGEPYRQFMQTRARLIPFIY